MNANSEQKSNGSTPRQPDIAAAKRTTRGQRRAPARRTTAQPPDRDRETDVAVAAYYRAERRGFAPGNDLDDWVEAEREIEGDGEADEG